MVISHIQSFKVCFSCKTDVRQRASVHLCTLTQQTSAVVKSRSNHTIGDFSEHVAKHRTLLERPVLPLRSRFPALLPHIWDALTVHLWDVLLASKYSFHHLVVKIKTVMHSAEALQSVVIHEPSTYSCHIIKRTVYPELTVLGMRNYKLVKTMRSSTNDQTSI